MSQAATDPKFATDGPFSTMYSLMPDVPKSMEYVLTTLQTKLPVINMNLYGIIQVIAVFILIYAIATHGLAMIASKNQDALNGFIVKLLCCVFLISGSTQLSSGLRDGFYAVNGLGTAMSAGIVNDAISETVTLSMLATGALGAAGATKMGLSIATRGLGVAAKTAVVATRTAAVGGAVATAGRTNEAAAEPAPSAEIERAREKGLAIITAIEQWTSIVLVGLFPLMFAYYAVILSSGLLIVIVGLMIPIIAALSVFPSRIASISIGGSTSLLLGCYISTLFMPAFLGLCMAIGFVAPAKHLNSELGKSLNAMTQAAGVIAGKTTSGDAGDVMNAFIGLAGRSSVLNVGGVGEILTSGGKTLNPEYRAKMDTAYGQLTGSLVTAIVGVVVSLTMMVVGILVMIPVMKQGPSQVGQIMGAMIHTGGIPNGPRIPTLPAQPKAALSGGSGGSSDGGSRMSVKQIGSSRQALGAPKVSGDLAARGAGAGSGSGAGGGVTVVASASRHELPNRTVEARSGPRQALPPGGRG